MTPLLIEIGCEELPSGSVARLGHVLSETLHTQMKAAFDDLQPPHFFATARRLAFIFPHCPAKTHPQSQDILGPLVSQAFDAKGNPTPAGLGFAQRCGIELSEISSRKSEKGDRLYHTQIKPAKDLSEIARKATAHAIEQLQGFKTMRWHSDAPAFLRPIRWIMMMHGSDVLEGNLLHLQLSPHTYGHRFVAPEALMIPHVDAYQDTLRTQGHIIVDAKQRKGLILEQIEALTPQNATVQLDESVLEELLYLVEYPHTMMGSFSETYLRLPEPILEAVFHHHQKCFHITQADKTLPLFIFVSHIPSRQPEHVIEDVKRVLHARLSDALFFYDEDCQKKLLDHQSELSQLVFHPKLGHMQEKQDRIRLIMQTLELDPHDALIQRLKADLCTKTVRELPKLQGIVGSLLAKNEKLAHSEVFLEHLRPRSAQDALPSSALSATLAIADRMDSLTGFFGLKAYPTGDKDPYALRRQALAVLRIMIDQKMTLTLKDWIHAAIDAHSVSLCPDTATTLWHFLLERLRHDVPHPELFDAITWAEDAPLYHGLERLHALHRFLQTQESQKVCQAHKRMHQLLKKQEVTASLQAQHLDEDAEKALYDHHSVQQKNIEACMQRQDYTQAWAHVRELSEPIDEFFNSVMVMCDDDRLRANRLALIKAIHQCITKLADLSKIQLT